MKNFKVGSALDIQKTFPSRFPKILLHPYGGFDSNNYIETYPTDYALLNNCKLYGPIYNKKGNYWISEDSKEEDYLFYGGSLVIKKACVIKNNVEDNIGIRPAFNVHKGEISGWNILDFIFKYQYGMYPTFHLEENLEQYLEKLFASGKLALVYSSSMYDVYLCMNKYFARVIAREDTNNKYWDGEKIISNKTYWFNVTPITWYYNPRSGQAFSKLILDSGVKYNDLDKYFNHFNKDLLLNQNEKNYYSNEELAVRALNYYYRYNPEKKELLSDSLKQAGIDYQMVRIKK